LCEEGGTLEKSFYTPLMETANAVLDVVSWSDFKDIPSEKHQYCHVNNSNHNQGGVVNKNGLSPDLVLLHKNHPCPRPDSNKSLHWVNLLHALEVNLYDSALCDGRNMPRLVVDGKCPMDSFCIWP